VKTQAHLIKRSRRGLLAVVSISAALWLVPVASASSPVDQSNVQSVCCGIGVASPTAVAQTFTAGRTGLLTEVALAVQNGGSTPTAPLQVDITQVSGGFPDLAHVIGSGTIAPSSVTGSSQVVLVTLTVQPLVTSGVQYGIVASYSTTNSDYFLGHDNHNDYSGGTSFTHPGSWITLPWDLSFATYVGPAPPAASTPSHRAGYCTVVGNTSDTGAALPAGAFVNLDDGQNASDPNYYGATRAAFVAGEGLTCDSAPIDYKLRGFATTDMGVDGGLYPYYAP
jgi:hypothetical protein